MHRPSQSISSLAAANSASSLEASAADLVLLNQSLAKSKKVSDRLGTMLTGFDERLSKLEKSLAPIHKDTRNLTRMSSNIDQTLRAIDQLLGNRDAALRQESLIRKGPRPEDIGPYTAALDDIAKTAAGLSRSGGDKESARQMASIIETGGKKLAGIFAIWIRDATGSPLPDANRLLVEGSAFPALSQSRITKLAGLSSYLRNLPPPTGREAESEAQIAYSDARSKYLADSLRVVAAQAVQAAERGGGAGMFTSYLDCLFEMANVEYSNASSIFRGPALTAAFAGVLPPALSTLYETGQALHALLKKSLTTSVAFAFETYEALSDRAGLFDSDIRGRAGRRESELADLIHSLRGTCLRCLPEFIEDVKAFGAKPPGAAEAGSSGVADMTKAAVEFMRVLCERSQTAEGFLSMLGDGNWMFGGPGAGRGGRSSEALEGTLLPKYLNDVLSALLTALELRSKTLRLPSNTPLASSVPTSRSSSVMGAIFYINNISHARRMLLETASISDQLGESAEDELNKRMRAAKSGYLDAWSPLISALMDAGGDESRFGLRGALPGAHGGAERREVKDRFGRFNEAFEEVEGLHKVARLAQDDAEMRDRLRDEVERMIVPTYAKFAQRHEGGQFSKNPSKYLKMSGDQLEERLDLIFE